MLSRSDPDHRLQPVRRSTSLAACFVVGATLLAAACGSGAGLAGDQDADDADADAMDIPEASDAGDADADADADPDGSSSDDGSDAFSDAPAGDADARPDAMAGTCGDGVRNIGEGCDDGNAIDDDGCRNDCSLPTCGDGLVSDVEECDDGPANSDTDPDACRTRCVRPTCGDGVVDTGERCDDGNRVAGDACPPGCFPEDEVPAEPIGDPEPADDPFDTGGPPVVDWNGTGWGVAWGISALRFRALDADAHPVGPEVILPMAGLYSDIAWGEDRFALVAANRDDEIGVLTTDAMGIVRSGPAWLPDSGDEPRLAWSPTLAGWVVAYNQPSSGGGPVTAAVRALLVDERSRIVDGPIDVGEGMSAVPVPMRSRVGVAWSGAGGIRFRSFPWPDASGGSEVLALPMFIHSDGGLDATAYYDHAVLVGMDGAHVLVAVVDALSGEVEGDPASIADSGVVDRKPRLQAVPERGILGVCYSTGPGPASGTGFGFRVIRPDGSPVGSEVAVATGLRNAGSCDVGWSGSEFIVLYWSCGGDAEWNTVYAQRVRPLL